MKNRKTSPKYAPEMRERAVRTVFDHAGEYPSQWAAIESVAAKIGWRISRTAHAGFMLDAMGEALHYRRPVGGGLVHHSDRGVQGGFKWSSQRRSFSLMAAARQASLPAFSSQASFSVVH